MSLELSKVTATSILVYAKHQKDQNNAAARRHITSAKSYYANYMRDVKSAAKSQQEANEWERVIQDLKNYEPDRELSPALEEFIELIRKDISKGKDVLLKDLIPDE